ncbi:MAG TPA: hypothetical protein VK855_05325 [Thioalkalivibrio sp.]|nr:hypothetical protein [Thioalkalivibrio sp.]
MDTGFWNRMAHAIRNTRAAIAAIGMLVVLGVLLYDRWSAPDVLRRDVVWVPVVAVERDSEAARWLKVSVETPDDGVIRVLWMATAQPFRPGSQAELMIIDYADGSRDYRLMQRP